MLAVAVSLSMIAVVLGALPAATAGECNGAQHAPILITSDAGFTAANGVVSGTGTPSDPYVIANLVIKDMSLGYGIKVDNSAGAITKYFAISCISSNWKIATPSGGYVVWLVGVHTATTVTQVVSNSGELPNTNGIRVENSSYVLLSDESINKIGGDGAQIIGSDHITILDSKLKSANNGLTIEDSHDVVVGQTCSVGGGQGCDEFTYDDNNGLRVDNSSNVQVIDTMTSADDTGGIVLSGTGTYNVTMTGGEATANGPICHSGTYSGYVSDAITGIAVVNGAYDITVHGYTMQANGDGGGGYYDIMNGGKGLYLNPCGGLVTLPKTAPGGANLDFSGNCFTYEYNFSPVPVPYCPTS